MVRPLALSVVLLAAVAVSACSTTMVEPTFSSIQSEVFEQSCAFSGCHDAGAAGELDLRAAGSYAALIDVDPDEPQAVADGFKRVVPGDPDNSYLYVTLLESLRPEYSNLMPKNSPTPLSGQEVEAIRQWIADGALDN